MSSSLLRITGTTLLGFLLIVAAVFVTSPSAHAGDGSGLPNGRNTIIGLEAYARDRNASCPNTRDGLNNCGMPYWSTNWISPRNQPTKGESLTLPATTTSVPLQLNSFAFLTAATSARDSGGSCGLGTIHYTSGSAPNMVTNGNYPNDRNPASTCYYINYAALRGTRYKVYSANVASGNGTLSGVNVGGIFGTRTQSNSRYTYNGSPVNFTYESGFWTAQERTVTIRFNVAAVSLFHANTYLCYRGGNPYYMSSESFDSCDRQNIDYRFTFYVTPVWNVIPSSEVKSIAGNTSRITNAKPGELVQWQHDAYNEGPDPTSKASNVRYQNRLSDNSTWQDPSGGTTGTDRVLPSGSNIRQNAVSFTSTHTVTQDDVDRLTCRTTRAAPNSLLGTGAESPASGRACFFTPYDYSLTPITTIASDEISDGFSTIRVNPSVQNSGPTKSRSTEWRLTKMIVAPSGTIPNSGGGTSGTAPCNGNNGYFRNATTVCSTEEQGNSVFDTRGNVLSGDALSQQAVDIEDFQIGTKICFAFSVRPHSSASGDWRHSAAECVTIGKRPKVQFHGGDLSLGKKFLGQTTIAPAADAITSTTVKRQNAAAAGSYDPRSISGFYGTGVDETRTPIRVNNTAVVDQHWRISSILPGSRADAEPCQGAPGSAYAVVTNTYDGQRSPLDPSSGNTLQAWSLTPAEAKASWIGANPLASNTYYKEKNPSANCDFPANFSTNNFIPFTYKGVNYTDKEVAFRELAPVWNYTTNFTVNNDSSCIVNLDSIQLNLRMSVDDEATIYINGVAVATKENSELKAHDQWPRSLVSVLTNKTAGAFRLGVNTLTVAVKSHSTSTGLIVGGDFSSQADCQTPPASKTFGSWVEYGIFATGRVGVSAGFGPSLASGSAYGQGEAAGLASATVCSTSTLTFTSADSASGCSETADIGGYNTTRSIPDVASNFPVTDTTSVLAINNFSDTSVQGVYTASSDVTIIGGTIGAGRWVVLNAPDVTVTITGNITYTGDVLRSASEIPQVIIIAKNIVIADTVTQVDAWLIARGSDDALDGTINTCGIVAGAPLATTAPLTYTMCSQQLVVNGPVMANKLFLRRTFGSGPGGASSDPAEVFNLRPDAFLWAAARSEGDGRIKTVYSTELPPRL